MPDPHSVVLVCFGNLCRSPMAHGLMQARLPGTWRVASAGTYAMGGDPPTSTARRVIQEDGIDIGEQRSQPLTVQAIEAAAHIFTMSVQQSRVAAALAPSAQERIRLFGAFTPCSDAATQSADPGGSATTVLEIPDPMGGDLQAYRACLERLRRAADAASAWLLAGADPATGPPPLSHASWPRSARLET